MSKSQYVFRRLRDGKRIKRTMTHTQFEKCRVFGTRFRLRDGTEATLVETPFDRLAKTKKPTPRKHSAFARPMHSQAMGCHPSQVTAFNERARQLQTGAEYLPDGTCKLETRGIRKKEMDARDIFDADAGYGDKAPDHATSSFEKQQFVKPKTFSMADADGEM